MSKTDLNEEFFTTLKNDTFLRLADNSQMGITIIRRGHLQYFNDKFAEIFGYNTEEIHKWERIEYFKIIHPEDIPQLLKKIKIEDKNSAILRFRGVKKNGEIIPVENYIYLIRYDNKFSYFSTYIQLGKPIDELYLRTIIKIIKQKKLVVNYHPKIVKFFKENNIDYEIINHCSYREEK